MDTKIAEEQAKQRQSTQSPSRRPQTGASRGVGRSDSTRNSNRARNAEDERGIPQKGPDPSEFVIDDEDPPSRSVTPKPPPPPKDVETPAANVAQAAPQEERVPAESDTGKSKQQDDMTSGGEELPQHVRQKLRKLDKLESRYHDLLRSYRIAHSRVTAIEPFEAALRENTPLTSTNDPNALIEYLSQVNLRGDMVMEELKRVTGERDSIKSKLDDAERRAQEAYDEAAGLRKERDDISLTNPPTESKVVGDRVDPLGVEQVNAGATTSVEDAHVVDTTKDQKGTTTGSDDFFSYESEVPRLQSELEDKTQQIGHLKSENDTLKSNLDTARESEKHSRHALDEVSKGQGAAKDDYQRQKLDLEQRCEASERAVQDVTAQLDSIHATSASEKLPLAARVQSLGEHLAQAHSDLDSAKEHIAELKQKTASAEDTRERLEKESKDVAIQDTETREARDQDKKRIDTLDGLVKVLKSQLDDAAATRTSLQSDLDTLRTELQQSTEDCEAAKKASMSTVNPNVDYNVTAKQLKMAEQERDDAYHMIVKCGSCKLPERTVLESAQEPALKDATSPGEGDAAIAQTVDGDSAAAKKKKNKNKKKKKAPAAASALGDSKVAGVPIVPAVVAEPMSQEHTPESSLSLEQKAAIHAHVLNSIRELRSDHDAPGAESAQKSEDLENLVQQKDAEIKALNISISEKESRILELTDKLKGEEDLREEIEGLKDDLMEIGNEHVGAKDQLKEMRARSAAKDGEHAEDVKRLEDKCKALQERCDDLNSQLTSKTLEMEKTQEDYEHLKTTGSTTAALEEQLSQIEGEKEALTVANAELKKEAASLKSSRADSTAASEERQRSLAEDLDQHKSKAVSLQTDLAAANELAQIRYKDLTALREHTNKMQPELNTLRKEVAELKASKEELNSATTTVRKLEGREKDLKAEILLYKTRAQEKEAEFKSLNEQLKQSHERKATLEETVSKAQKDLQRAEGTRKETEQVKDRLSKDLGRTQDDLQKSREKLQDLEKQVAQFSREARTLKGEVELKSAQQASSQSLVDSMQDQTRELATQMKEIKERCESLEEELADAHRLLSERSREGETMRRLLADVESRAESRVKEMRERLDLATEERDRAEEEASTVGRRKARELEDAKNKLREAERALGRALEEQEDFDRREQNFRKQKDTLEQSVTQAQEEVTEVRSAMAQLRDAMDDGERHSREFEKEKLELRKALEDKEQRLEKLQKSSKAMADELRSWQNMTKTRQPSNVSARSSFDSSRMSSPASKSRNGAPMATTGGSDAHPGVDYVYLKNVLLQFLEQKDKKHQMQLVPVLGMLLHFDK